VLAERLRPLFKHDVGLAAYHLPLDAHPEVGNNALLAEGLGCAEHEAFATIGRARGRSPARASRPPTSSRAWRSSRSARRSSSTRTRARAPDRDRVRAGASRLPLAVAEGFDAFLTGEPSEHVMADAREAGIHFIAAGHYATETFGVRRLGDWLAARFGSSTLDRHPQPV
jgi:putative NIF3 family GTP cyclohydrolase 1 type 2